MPAMRKIAKNLGHDHELALLLLSSGIPDAQIAAGMEQQGTRWVLPSMDPIQRTSASI